MGEGLDSPMVDAADMDEANSGRNEGNLQDSILEAVPDLDGEVGLRQEEILNVSKQSQAPNQETVEQEDNSFSQELAEKTVVTGSTGFAFDTIEATVIVDNMAAKLGDKNLGGHENSEDDRSTTLPPPPKQEKAEEKQVESEEHVEVISARQMGAMLTSENLYSVSSMSKLRDNAHLLTCLSNVVGTKKKGSNTARISVCL